MEDSLIQAMPRARQKMMAALQAKNKCLVDPFTGAKVNMPLTEARIAQHKLVVPASDVVDAIGIQRRGPVSREPGAGFARNLVAGPEIENIVGIGERRRVDQKLALPGLTGEGNPTEARPAAIVGIAYVAAQLLQADRR